MRVLHILNELKPSGAETMLRSAAPYWRARGIGGEILATGESLGVYAEPLREAGYTLHHRPFRKSLAFFASVRHLITAGSFDTVHIHCERANFWYALAAFAAGVRDITRSVHSTFAFRGPLRATRAVERWILRNLIGVRSIAAGPAVQTIEWKHFRNLARPIPNWFDSERFRPPTAAQRQAARGALGIDPWTLAVITVGNCAAVKNHEAVIRALASIPANDEILYLHAGEEAHGAERALADSLGAASRIRFLGPVLDVAPYLHAADLFLMPSLYEGLGIAAVEAMGAGLPVVLGDSPGLRELSQIAAGAHLAAPEPAAFAQAILRFRAMSAAERQAIGLRLSAAVHARFAIETGAGEFANLYAEGTAPK